MSYARFCLVGLFPLAWPLETEGTVRSVVGGGAAGSRPATRRGRLVVPSAALVFVGGSFMAAQVDLLRRFLTHRWAG
jgi:hypothetical protein